MSPRDKEHLKEKYFKATKTTHTKLLHVNGMGHLGLELYFFIVDNESGTPVNVTHTRTHLAKLITTLTEKPIVLIFVMDARISVCSPLLYSYTLQT